MIQKLRDKLRDDKGLYLLVEANGNRTWKFSYRFDGRSKVITLEVTAKAEGQAVNRATLASGQTLLASDQDTIRIGIRQPLKVDQTIPAQAAIGVAIPLKTVVSNTSDTG